MNIYIRIGLCIIGAYVLAVAIYNLSIADGNLEVYVTNGLLGGLGGILVGFGFGYVTPTVVVKKVEQVAKAPVGVLKAAADAVGNAAANVAGQAKRSRRP